MRSLGSLSPRPPSIACALLGCLLGLLPGACGDDDASDPADAGPQVGTCAQDGDCPLGEICSIGRCRSGCRDDQRCPAEQRCTAGQCVQRGDGGEPELDAEPGGCPAEMALVEPGDGRRWCMDRYEAARGDATALGQGADRGASVSVAGVLPWSNLSWEEANGACAAAGKRLCALDEWITTCKGPGASVYPYGDDYVADACNGIDAHGLTPEGAQIFYTEPTGSFPRCVNGFDVYDLSGNLWEYTAGQDAPTPRLNGGAYNCIDSALLHGCDHVQYHHADYAAARSNGGFRCCRDVGPLGR